MNGYFVTYFERYSHYGPIGKISFWQCCGRFEKRMIL